MKKQTNGKELLFAVPVVLVPVLALLYFARRQPFIALGAIFIYAVFWVFWLVQGHISRRNREQVLETLAERMDITQQQVLSEYPVPVLVCDESEKILFYNERFVIEFAVDGKLDNKALSAFTGGADVSDFEQGVPYGVAVGERYFSLYVSRFHYNEKLFYALYYTDTTYYHGVEKEFKQSRPYVLLLDVDDVSQMGLGYRDSEYAEIRNGVESLMEQWADRFPCIMRKLNDARYIILAQQRDMDKMIAEKFSILDMVRRYNHKERELGITLSIGAGTGQTFADCETAAHRALEMAIGRGGDQAALKTETSYSFFGGVSSSGERRMQAKTRAVAASLTQLLSGCDSVVVMGHTYPDLDAMGTAVGILAIARSQGVPAHIVVNPERSLAQPLLERVAQEYDYDVIISRSQAQNLLQKNSVLIVVDTHIESFLDYPELYQAAKTRAVIDHHRKVVHYIDDALIFHHDPNASSTSEMVTELLQYITPELRRFEAEALLAGIMLDTKNFVLRTRVRTFRAAAYLKGKGANMVNVKRFFVHSIQSNKQRYALVANAELYHGCALSVTEQLLPDIRVVASGAADELLNVEGAKASFVVFKDLSGGANISARSYGDINVQLLMEKLGGGGHRTMAAAQFPDLNVQAVKRKLMELLDGMNPTEQREKTERTK